MWTIPEIEAYIINTTTGEPGFGYDANGNMTQMPGVTGTMTHDAANRLKGAAGETYGYGPDNRRVWRKTSSGDEVFTFWGVDGHRVEEIWFGGMQLGTGDGKMVFTDRVGSVRLRVEQGNWWNWEWHGYYPYGEEKTASAGNRAKFGTYTRDAATGLDYADQRYYASTSGRFLTPDPYYAPTSLVNPQEWNRYGYVAGDPVNNIDPTGQFIVPVFGNLFGWIGSLLGFGSSLAGIIPPFGGGVSFDPVGFIAAEQWKKDPGRKVQEWDIAIAAALVASQAREQDEPTRRYPHHLQLTQDCHVRGGYGGSVMRTRTYELRGQNDQMMAGGVRVTERNYVVQGNLGAYNSTWNSAIVIDFISKGTGPVTTQYQQFSAQVVSGIDSMPGAVPVMVRDPAHGDFGTLGIKMEKDVIFINGDDGKVNGQYR